MEAPRFPFQVQMVSHVLFLGITNRRRNSYLAPNRNARCNFEIWYSLTLGIYLKQLLLIDSRRLSESEFCGNHLCNYS